MLNFKKRNLDGRSQRGKNQHPALLFDPRLCNGCRTCEMVCAQSHFGVVSTGKAAIRSILLEEQGKTYSIYCQHCPEPLCLEVCPVKAISRDNGLVLLDSKACVDCGLCMAACPEGAPLKDPETNQVQKCDLCKGQPACVAACPSQALRYMPASSQRWIRFPRWISQAAAFFLLVIVLVGTVCSLSVGEFSLSCPVGLLQEIVGSQTIILTTIFSAMVLLILAALLGRVFCGWLCPFGFVLDLVGRWIPRFGNPKILSNRQTKYSILAASMVASAAVGHQVFCPVCPIGTVCRSYGVKDFFLGSELAVIPVALAMEIGEKRNWCRLLCPVGAIFGLMSKMNLIKVVIGAHQCKKFSCMECAEICPVSIVDKDLLREGISPSIPMSECILCLRCVEHCPYGAAKVRFRGQEVRPQRVEDFSAAPAAASREPSS
jgi:NapH/MauN family ferredoxin-type protein